MVFWGSTHARSYDALTNARVRLFIQLLYETQRYFSRIFFRYEYSKRGSYYGGVSRPRGPRDEGTHEGPCDIWCGSKSGPVSLCLRLTSRMDLGQGPSHEAQSSIYDDTHMHVDRLAQSH